MLKKTQQPIHIHKRDLFRISLLALILVLFYSQPNLPTFAIFLFTLVTFLIGMIFGIVGLFKDKGMMMKLSSMVSVLVGLGYLIFLARIIVTGSTVGA